VTITVASRSPTVLPDTAPGVCGRRTRPRVVDVRASMGAMADQEDVRRIAMALPEVVEAEDRFAFSVRTTVAKGKHAGTVKDKGFAWVWLERIHPKKARVPQPKVLAVSVADLGEKEVLLASDTDVFFTEAHYHGYPAVMVRLEAVALDELEELIIDAWRCQAPAGLVEQYDRDHPV